jgi:hypothetical protein
MKLPRRKFLHLAAGAVGTAQNRYAKSHERTAALLGLWHCAGVPAFHAPLLRERLPPVCLSASTRTAGLASSGCAIAHAARHAFGR